MISPNFGSTFPHWTMTHNFSTLGQLAAANTTTAKMSMRDEYGAGE